MAGNYDIQVEKGGTFQQLLTWKDASGALVDLTNYTARMQVRETYDSSSFLVELTTANGAIVLGGVAGTITLNLTATATDAFVVPDDGTDLPTRSWRYDLELVNGAYVKRLLYGKFTVSGEISQ